MRKSTIFQLMLLITFLLIVGNLFKYHLLSIEAIIRSDKLISVIKDVITVLALIFGAILSYFRFFNGRTFAPKAEIEFDCTLIRKSEKVVLHAIRVSLINKGNLSIWNPKAKILVYKYISEDNYEEEEIGDFEQYSLFQNDGERDILVDVGERISFNIWKEIDESVWAVVYTAEVATPGGTSWQNSVTVPNRAE